MSHAARAIRPDVQFTCCQLQIGACGTAALFFFFFLNELDECVSIDIAEKYKGIALGGHNQEKEKETRE